MKKIIAVFDGINFSDHTSRFACELAEKSDSLLVGVFLHDLTYARFVTSYSWDMPTPYAADFEKISHEDDHKIRENIKRFNALCESRGIMHKVHLDSGVPLQELLKESAFADVMLIDTKTSFISIGETFPNVFLKDLLTEARCPVIILPDQPTTVRSVIIAYDGSDSSAYALKMFSYLFPEWKEMETTIVTVNHSSSNHIPKNRDVKDLAGRHFKKLSFTVLSGKPDDELEKYLKKAGPDTVVVMGAYGRSTWSRMFHESMSNKILRDVKVPLFITHQ